MNEQPPSLWQNSQFKIYLGSTAFTGNATAMQQLLLSWLMVGILLLPADQVGMIQAVIGLPGIVLMLWGGASADRTDARSLLIKVYAVAWLFPLALFGMTQIDLLNIWTVSLFGIAMSTAISFSNPAQQSILNRVVGADVQRGVTAATAMGFIVQMLGLVLAGQMEIVGVGDILLVQSASLVLGALAVM
ncbi:MAG: MFS transporter, partial [Proteobacteria bacterium]|nr:MFS transporter [Pseudomonadota bacterium]